MSIIKRPPTPAPGLAAEQAIANFIQSAPDAGAATSKAQSSDMTEQITIRIPKALLERATRMAERQGIPRASYIKRALALQLEQDEK